MQIGDNKKSLTSSTSVNNRSTKILLELLVLTEGLTAAHSCLEVASDSLDKLWLLDYTIKDLILTASVLA